MQHPATLHIPTTIPAWCEWDQAWPILKAEHPTIASEIHEVEPQGGRMIAIATVDYDLMADDHPTYIPYIVAVTDIHGNPLTTEAAA